MVEMPDIEKGMTVYDVNGDKIGSVDEVWSPLPGEQTAAPAASGGGAGALGDESRVTKIYGHGGSGALGDESRLGQVPGHGGSGALGNEAMAGSSSSQPDDTGQMASAGMPGESAMDDLGPPIEEVVVAEEVISIPSSNASGMAGERSGGAGYFKVEQGGVLGFGAKALYIPFGAVQSVVPGDRVVLSGTKEECDSMYGQRPESLGESG